jgi:hypothetical protein
MASEVKTNKVSPASGTNVTLGNSGDTVSLGSGATASGFLPSSISTSGDDFQFNSGYGSVATAYGCRAWVNFDGRGSDGIRESGNVSSITDNGTGDYTINFSTSMPDSNYTITGLGSWDQGLYIGTVIIEWNVGSRLQTKSTTACGIRTWHTYNEGYYDADEVQVSIFR